MKLALYLPNFRDKVTVKELEDLTALAEELDFDSVWTLDRIVVPEASDRGELQYSFGMMDEFPKQLPVTSRGQWYQGWPLIPWLAAKTQKVRIGMSITDTPFRAPGVLAAELATVDHLSSGRLNVGVGAGWMPEEFAAASAAHIFPKRHKHVRESIEIMQGIWTNDLFEYHGEFADFDPLRVRRQAAPGPAADLVQRAQGPQALGAAGRQVRPGGLDRHPGHAGGAHHVADRDRARAVRARASRSTTSRCRSMIWFVITDEDMDQTNAGKGTNLLVGSAEQITEMLKRYKEAGLTMPMLWPPFADVPVAKTLDDLKRLKEDIMPKVEAA